jgi:DNA end-binding protein Ku
MPRALKNLDISLGLAVIPIQLFTATSSKGVAFHLLHARCGSRIQMRLECPIHGIVPREETVRGYEIAKDEYVRFEPEELKALEQASSSALVIDSFVPEGAIDPVYFEDTYYVGAGKNGERGYRVLVAALQKTQRVAVGTFRWRGKTTPIAIRAHQDGLLLQRLYFADEVQNAAAIDQGAAPKIRDQERTLAERLISELSGTELRPENYEDEYRKRVLKAIEQKVAGHEIERVEVEPRPATTFSGSMMSSPNIGPAH